MGIRIDGLDEMMRSLGKLAQRAERLDGEYKVAFADLMPTDFVRRFTDFLTLDEMMQASGYKIESSEDFEKIPSEEWDIFIQQNTLFGSWEEMRGKAVAEWAASKLGLED
ncbi:MAG: hypothetical protein KJ066_00125 [Acidobacteria bacterium]|nr:hypothetical protein [Acidobacteriota bacterium]